MISTKFLFVVSLVGVSVGDPTNTIVPCRKSDQACIEASAKAATPKFFKGFPEFGVDSSDPLPLDEIVGDLSTLKFKFTNTTAVGLSGCVINKPNLDLDNSKLSLELTCTDVTMSGHYVISGQLLILPVEGDGDYSIFCKKYLFTLDADLKQVQGSDGQQHLAVKNFKFTSDAQAPISYDFKNLFNGQKDLAEGVLKFANENWKEVADFVQEPVISVLLKRVVKNLNKFLKLVSVDELFLAD
ncbi:hypothetical protein NE865_01985 [Phthorimaea operculella]|nr:hypothetical protein NE865_01985 [Phthorimaea operculella]